jgi:hypothetical protein
MEVWMSRHLINRSAAVAMAAALLFSSVATVSAAVSTDQPDYSPGSVVTISGDNSNGAGYLPWETVDVAVSGPNEWTASCSGEAQEDGSWACQVTLSSDPDVAVGEYYYTATGQASGTTETGTFTDNVGVTIDNLDPNDNNRPWYNGDPASVPISGTYTCTATGTVCTSPTSVVVTVRTRVAANNGFTGTIVGQTAASVLSGGIWSHTFSFADAPAGLGQAPDGQYDVQVRFNYLSGSSPKFQDSNVSDDHFGIDRVKPTSTIDPVTPSDMPTATGDATDPGAALTFSGFNTGNPKPMHVELRTNPGNVLVDQQDLPLANLGSSRQAGDWSYSYTGSALTPGAGYCLTSVATDRAGNVQSSAASECFTVPSVDGSAPTNVSIEINGGAAWTNTTAASLHIHGEDNVGVTGAFVSNGGTAVCDAASFASYTAVGPTTSYDNNALAHVLTAGDGTKTVCVVFRDAAGNKTSAQDTIGLDATAPVITKSIPGTPQYNDGTNDFVTSATTIRVSVVEAGSGLDSCVIDIDGPAANDTSFNCTTSDNDFTLGGVLATPPDGSYVISVDAEDVAGNPGNDPLTVILDNTAPDNYSETLGSPNYTDGSNNVWVRSTTNISVSGDDGTGSGVKSCTKAFDGGATSAYTLAANFNMPSGDGAHSYAIVCKDNLDNTSGPFSKTRYVDDTGPLVTVTGVTNGATYILGSVPAAGCGTSDGAGSGVATSASLTGPTGLGPNGVGTANGSCGGATDNLGNPQSPDPLSFTFYVIYDPAGISGILQPINPDNTSVFKRGQSVPVKFSLAGDEFFGFVTSGWLIQRQSVLCNVFDGNDATLESVPSNTPSQYFRYDASADQYIYNADMKNLGVGTCWNFKVTLDSGQILYSAVFKLTK